MKTYKVKDIPIRHGGKLFMPGDPIDLEQKDALRNKEFLEDEIETEAATDQVPPPAGKSIHGEKRETEDVVTGDVATKAVSEQIGQGTETGSDSEESAAGSEVAEASAEQSASVEEKETAAAAVKASQKSGSAKKAQTGTKKQNAGGTK